MSWKEKPHLGFRPGDPAGIYVNCEQMRLDLDAVYGRYRRYFQETSQPGRTLPDSWTRARDKPAHRDAVAGWWRFMMIPFPMMAAPADGYAFGCTLPPTTLSQVPAGT